MLRPAFEESLTAFEEREGVRISRVYNGRGILVAQIKSRQHPDAYFAGDREFMSQVKDLFPKPVDVSQNELVHSGAEGKSASNRRSQRPWPQRSSSRNWA